MGSKRFTFGEDPTAAFGENALYRFYYCQAGGYQIVLSYEKVT